MLKMKRRVKFWVWPYKGGSNAAARLADVLGGRRIKRENSRYRRQVRDFVINWGSTSPLDNGPVVNHYDAVRVATSKMATFRALADAGVQVPAWTQDRDLAREWVGRGRVLGRDLDHGSQGKGITVYEKDAEIGEHLFYVRYMRKDREFRVHVVKGTVIFVQEKLKKKEVENVGNKYVRSHRYGWCFAFHHLAERPAPQAVLDIGVAGVAALGLDFGAVDIAWSERSGPTILEVNTAPGIEESSLVAYADAFQRLL
jgi:hypothetical protein